MHPYISCLFSLAVKPAEFAEFKRLIATIVAATKAEPGTLVYEYSVNEDNSTVKSLVVYGTPDAEIRKRLDPFGAVYMTPFDGFSR